MDRPLLTFGVTAYNRTAMLKECLTSILQQTHGDFEVIVGNDYVAEPVTQASLGLSDPRIRIVNHPENLGEVPNMNFLLGQARGRYFLWLADDDLVMPQFLESVYQAVKMHPQAKCVYSSYNEGTEYTPVPEVDVAGLARCMTGREYLYRYLMRRFKLIGCYGGIETAYLKQLGGIRTMGSGFSPYADNLLAIQAGMLEQVVYIDAPLIFFRTHGESRSTSSIDLTAYTTAQEELLTRCHEILSSRGLAEDYRANMKHLLQWCLGDIFSVVRRSGMPLLSRPFVAHLGLIHQHARTVGRFYPGLVLQMLMYVVRHAVRRVLPRRSTN